ncbi:MAG: NAD(P)-binding domain-containing protein, partial [Acidovorax sp.]
MTTTTPLRIAVLGIGMMGLPMARRLCAAGHQVH